MKVALANGVVGFILCLLIGTGFMNLSAGEVVASVIASNLAALIALLGTLRVEKSSSPMRKFVGGSFKTWMFLSSLYLGLLLLASPPLRDLRTLCYMILPLLLNLGFSIIIFGPIQDWIVAQNQRKQLSNCTEQSLANQ